MKARIKKTGEIVNLASYAKITLDQCDSWGNPIEMKPEDVELINDNEKNDDFAPYYWEKLRHQAAISAMNAFALNDKEDAMTFCEIAQMAKKSRLLD